MMVKIVLVGGGTASGKTHVIKEVCKLLGEENILHFSLDDYYKDLSDMPFEERVKQNYDHPKAFDWKLMREHIKALRNGVGIDKPIYDFTIHNRSKNTEFIEPKKVIIAEGIMSLVDKEIRSYGDLKVFIKASNERRLVRRIERDTKLRGRTYDSVVKQYFETVQPMFEEIIGPSQYYADLIINNDGYENNSIKVLSLIIKHYLENDD
ncbi:MAG: uridine kinase [Bacilli bacterium]|nr:uridine kinase [Bacilli bacterium]